jgi:hypothetical protein
MPVGKKSGEIILVSIGSGMDVLRILGKENPIFSRLLAVLERRANKRLIFKTCPAILFGFRRKHGKKLPDMR